MPDNTLGATARKDDLSDGQLVRQGSAADGERIEQLALKAMHECGATPDILLVYIFCLTWVTLMIAAPSSCRIIVLCARSGWCRWISQPFATSKCGLSVQICHFKSFDLTTYSSSATGRGKHSSQRRRSLHNPLSGPPRNGHWHSGSRHRFRRAMTCRPAGH